MSFCEKLEENLEDLELYQLLENEMSKYKTLNHDSIQWDKVYEYALQLLEKHTVDVKIANYFMLACLVLNNELCFEKMAQYYEFFIQILTQNPSKLGGIQSQNSQKKKLKNMSEHFINELNKNELAISQKTSLNLAHIFQNLEELFLL